MIFVYAKATLAKFNAFKNLNANQLNLKTVEVFGVHSLRSIKTAKIAQDILMLFIGAY